MITPAEADKVVLDAIGQGSVYLHELERRLGLVPSRSGLIASLKRLSDAGLVVREEVGRESKNGRPKTAYRGRGPQPTVFWRRA